MNVTSRKSRRRPGAVRAAVLGACVVGSLVLTACNGDGDATGSGAGASPTTAGDAAGKATSTGAPSKKPGVATSSGSTSTAKSPAAVPAASKSPAPAASSAGGSDDGCDHKMPISPDEVAVYRYTPEGGSLSLIVKHGNWGCGSPDSDGAPFETVGKETFIPMDQAAYVTVTNPVVGSTENQHIGVQEFLDWLEAHPNSGLVFTYHLGADGAIDRLDEVFTP
ncbi:hypothetical protein [Streptomyces pseudovenezuelae]|uniref:hypothetical protein n=1 Tax=Streptomyces pseudovenezuelae TaxID=67350 RepID=UPI00371BFA21